MTTLPMITSALFQAMINLGANSPFPAFPDKTPLAFSSVSNMKIITDSYTPNNDYKYVLQGLLLANAPTFLIMVSDGPLSVTRTFQNGSISIAQQKFSFLEWVADPNNPMTGMFIDGRLNPNPYVTPMAQGQLVNYYIIAGQASIT